MDGDGYTELLDHPDGAAHYGAWIALLLIAAKCKPRGTLARSDGSPHNPATLRRLSGVSPAVYSAALARLVKIGWIEVIQQIPVHMAVSGVYPALPGVLAAQMSPTHTQQDTPVHTRTEHTHTIAPVNGNGGIKLPEHFDRFWERYPLKVERDAACHAYLSVVRPENEVEVFACLGRYLASDQVFRSVVSKPANWLFQQDRDGWKADWPLNAAEAKARRLAGEEE